MEPAQKKGPGRPKKVIGAPVEPVRGIIDPPADDPSNLAGLTYASPTLFRRIFQLFKHYAVSEVEMQWGPTGIDMVVIDHLMVSHIAVRITGAMMNAFYCAEPVRFQLRRGCLDHIVATINKAHTRLTMVLRQTEAAARLSLIIDVTNSEINSHNSHCVDATRCGGEMPPCPYDDTDYPIKLHFTAAHFKMVVTNARKLSKTITFEKVGDAPLRLTFPTAVDVGWNEVYSSPDKIGLESTLGPDEIFTIDMMLDYIKPLSNNAISTLVYIAAHATEHMSFTCYPDAAAVIKIYTKPHTRVD